ncbi:hypothetical protein J1N35_009261 [Gossypium stocksii]|uniref:Profilin n=1 Tax=Gossypium stocksii TaxID=47602 RepID=A0A9D4AB89_9ROSI|nr:hypothetical protein J1N35_009261 [Gossypium stocksii]
MQNLTTQKMSWQTYVDEHLMCDIEGQGQHLKSAAIVGHDGSVWAQSSAFPRVIMHHSNVNPFLLNASEVTDIMKDFDEPGHLAPKGLHLPVQSIWSYRVSLVLSFVEKREQEE